MNKFEAAQRDAEKTRLQIKAYELMVSNYETLAEQAGSASQKAEYIWLAIKYRTTLDQCRAFLARLESVDQEMRQQQHE